MNIDSLIVTNTETFHDTGAAYIKNGKLKCILETERVSKHKHAEYSQTKDLVNYIKNVYNLTDVFVRNGNDNYKYKTHHEMHAIGSFLSSGYDKACILVIDGEGDLEDSVTLYYGENGELKQLRKYHKEASLGEMYTDASLLVYGNNFSEGKLMGLSCCNSPEYSIPSPVQYDTDGNVKILYDSSFEDYIKNKFYYLFDNNGILKNDVYKAKIAATVQWWFTEQVLNLVRYLKKLYPDINNLCLAGGCFLNCETNGEIDKLDLYDNIYCPSAPADNGLLLGKIQQVLPKPQTINHAYWGPDYFRNFNELEKVFMLYHENDKLYSHIDSIKNISKYTIDSVINKLKQNKIIIWFDGKSEFGPRALGHRSFLVNPQMKDVFVKLSIDIKNRESYRPLAPITTDNLYSLIFEDIHPNNLTQFMLKTVKIKEEWINKIPAVCHINKTARPQRLIKDINNTLYDLIEAFYKETGIPCLINTSLNLKNQPLLENYEDLLDLIRNSKLSGTSVVVNGKLCFDIE